MSKKKRTPRIDSVSRLIAASPEAIYAAFAKPGAMERWLPPKGMAGAMLHFDFRDGGSYRMRLSYQNVGNHGRGKSSDDADEVEVQLIRLIPPRLIEQAATFVSDDPDFAGVMRMTWTFEAMAGGTRVTITAEDVPRGIRPRDHAAGMNSTLDNLAAYLA